MQSSAAALATLPHTCYPSALCINCLVNQLCCPHSSAKAQDQAACALWRVAAHCEGCKTLVAATAVTTLVTCLQSSSAEVQAQAAGALCSLSSGSEGRKAGIAAAGAVPALVSYLLQA